MPNFSDLNRKSLQKDAVLLSNYQTVSILQDEHTLLCSLNLLCDLLGQLSYAQHCLGSRSTTTSVYDGSWGWMRSLR